MMFFSIQNPISQALNPAQFEGYEEFQEDAENFPASNHQMAGSLKFGSKQFLFKPCSNLSHLALKALIRLNFFSEKTNPEIKLPFTSLQNESASRYHPSNMAHSKFPKLSHTDHLSSFKPSQGSAQRSTPKSAAKLGCDTTLPGEKLQSTPYLSDHTKASSLSQRKIYLGETGRQEKSERRDKQEGSSLVQYRWAREETLEWWESRYRQKERQGGDQQKQDQQEQHDRDENPSKVVKGTLRTSRVALPPSHFEKVDGRPHKPDLVPPKMGVFALYYILTKIGIYSDSISNFSYKKEIEMVDSEASEVHKQRLDALKVAIQKEKESVHWGIAYKVFSWLGSILAIITGIALIASGVGAVGGAMLLIGGLIQITSQILDVTGGWKKIAELLPGDDSEKKGAIITWMQIGIAVLCLILSVAGAIWGGYSHFGAAMQYATGTIGGIASMAQGITIIGQGVTLYHFYNRLGDIKHEELRLARLKHHRKNLMEKVEEGVDRLEKHFEDLARALEFEVELFNADQMLHRR